MKKILFAASTLSHIKNFHLPYLQEFHNRGYEVWVAANSIESIPYADHVVALPFAKSLLTFQNVKAIFLARKLLKKQNFDTVSTHTALASAVVRAAILMLHKKPKVFCTIHGYLFHENDGLKKWIYLLPEKICARVTNVLMVMNHEDYEIAERHHLYKEELDYINGMGIDLEKFVPATGEEKQAIRKKVGLAENDFLFVYAAEFSKRKNQAFLIRSFAEVCQEYPHMKLLLAGNGVLLEECKELVHQLHKEEQIIFLGYVSNMRDLYVACDACVSTSNIEGLPFNIMEAMACGLPVVASDIKGHRELTKGGRAGMLFKNNDSGELQKAIKLIYEQHNFRVDQKKGIQKQLISYELARVLTDIMKIYSK
ncbi:glycosyl transferase family 1 [Clostridium sp. W14A]|nr:glycosyl transferase family 1 [Clostridium sp. W14A]